MPAIRRAPSSKSSAYAPPRLTVCEVCDTTFTRSYDLKRHKESQHNPDAELKKIQCPYMGCTHRSLTQSNLNTHENAVHLKKRKYQCREDGCVQAFADGSARIHHERRIHGRFAKAVKAIKPVVTESDRDKRDRDESDSEDVPEPPQRGSKKGKRATRSEQQTHLYPLHVELAASTSSTASTSGSQGSAGSIIDDLVLPVSFTESASTPGLSYTPSPSSYLPYSDGESVCDPATPASYFSCVTDDFVDYSRVDTPTAYPDAESISGFDINKPLPFGFGFIHPHAYTSSSTFDHPSMSPFSPAQLNGIVQDTLCDDMPLQLTEEDQHSFTHSLTNGNANHLGLRLFDFEAPAQSIINDVSSVDDVTAWTENHWAAV